MRRTVVALVLLWAAVLVMARPVTVHVSDCPADRVFADIIRQTGMNFIYPSGLLSGMRVTLDVDRAPLSDVLGRMFRSTDIDFRIKGRNVTLFRRPAPADVVVGGYVLEDSTGEALPGALVADLATRRATMTNAAGFFSLRLPPSSTRLAASFPGYVADTVVVAPSHRRVIGFSLREAPGENMLAEVVVTAPRPGSTLDTEADVGRVSVTSDDIRHTPVVFGENDVVKTLQLTAGVLPGMEGFAGMYVHGGGADENLYMLDNVPLYQVSHFGGLFSAFNTEAVRNADFYKSSFPARYSGRLSGILDVRTRDGSSSRRSGSFRLGLTSGAFAMNGPIRDGRTTYSVALRRSWFDVLSVPALAIVNALQEDDTDKPALRYDFSDINLKLVHRPDSLGRIHAMFYYGEDYLKLGYTNDINDADRETPYIRNISDIARMHWGNVVGSLGWRRQLSGSLFGEFTAAMSHHFSRLRYDYSESVYAGEGHMAGQISRSRSSHSVTDFVLRADMSLSLPASHRLEAGADATWHLFKPHDYRSEWEGYGSAAGARRWLSRSRAFEGVVYVGDRFGIGRSLSVDAGLNLGVYITSGHTFLNLDPRVSAAWSLRPGIVLKGVYSRMRQYVRQLSESSISLPTDRWVPAAGGFRPLTSDKISLELDFDFLSAWRFRIGGYWKWMRNLIDYRPDYYLVPPDAPWTDMLCAGSGRARGVDLTAAWHRGPLSLRLVWSLLWADRRFPDLNGGRRFPAKYDNRHKITMLAVWQLNSRCDISAAWTGMTGNRVTFAVQDYLPLSATNMFFLGGDGMGNYAVDLVGGINNYRLPFYHRLDIAANLRTRHGMWTFSLYNAYCNMNVVGMVKDRGYGQWSDGRVEGARYRRLRLVPVIPSVSYTWFF